MWPRIFGGVLWSRLRRRAPAGTGASVRWWYFARDPSWAWSPRPSTPRSCWTETRNLDRVYYGTDTRAASLLVGASQARDRNGDLARTLGGYGTGARETDCRAEVARGRYRGSNRGRDSPTRGGSTSTRRLRGEHLRVARARQPCSAGIAVIWRLGRVALPVRPPRPRRSGHFADRGRGRVPGVTRGASAPPSRTCRRKDLVRALPGTFPLFLWLSADAISVSGTELVSCASRSRWR